MAVEISLPTLLRVKKNALHKIGKYLRNAQFTDIFLLWGEGIKELFFNDMNISLLSSGIRTISETVCDSIDIHEIFDLSLTIPSKSTAIVAIGGGKIIDIAKYISFINNIPLVAIPTVISNDGFGSPSSSLVTNGRRRTTKSTIPYGIIIDTEIIKNAPVRFLYSGIGDLLSKKTALFDWKLANRKTGIPVSDLAAIIAHDAFNIFYYYDQKDLNNYEYIRIIASSLLMSGIAMQIAGSSRPASGSEHLISHAYDKIATKPSLHGLQVGVATYLVSYLQQETHGLIRQIIQESGFVSFMESHRLNKREFIQALRIAPTMKDDWYTIISEHGQIEKAETFIHDDDIMKKMLE